MQSQSDKKLLVVGAGRSGTRYTAKILMIAGMDIGHEKLKVNGAVAAPLAVDDYFYSNVWNGPRRSAIEVDEVWHQVRHPLKVISSWETGPNLGHWHFQEKHTGASWDDKPIVRSAKYWLEWNRIIDSDPAVTMRFQVEKIPEVWDEMCRRLGLGDCQLPLIKTDFGAIKLERLGLKERVPVNWEDLEEMEGPVRLLAKEYGYE